MYTEGLQIGEKSYILQDDNQLKLATINGTKKEIEEYLQLNNEYEEKLEEKISLQKSLTQIYYNDKKAKKNNIEIFLTTLGIESAFIILSIISGTTPLILHFIVPSIILGTGILGKVLIYGTKKDRKRNKQDTSILLSKVQEELKELKIKIDSIKKQIEYNENTIKKDDELAITTVENKKVNVKMRVLKL